MFSHSGDYELDWNWKVPSLSDCRGPVSLGLSQRPLSQWSCSSPLSQPPTQQFPTFVKLSPLLLFVQLCSGKQSLLIMEVKQESLVSLTLPQPQLREKGAIVLLEEDLLGFKLSWYREFQGKPGLKSDMHYISRFVKGRDSIKRPFW